MVTLNVGAADFFTGKFWRAVFAEFLGMVFFLLAVSLVANPWNKAGLAYNDRSSDNLEIGLGIGLSITSSAMLVGHVSGGHLNPAVTLGCIFAGRISIIQGLFYIPAQMVGGITGSAIAFGLTPSAQRGQSNLGAVGLGKDVTEAQAFGLELMFTFVLVFFVLSITDPAKKTETYGTVLGIGVCIWVIHLLLIPMTGCGINPARAFAPAVVMNKFTAGHWAYWIGPFVAAPLAAFFYCVIFSHDKEE